MDYIGNVSRFSEVFCKGSNSLFASVTAESELMKNGLLSGVERRKRSMAALSTKTGNGKWGIGNGKWGIGNGNGILNIENWKFFFLH